MKYLAHVPTEQFGFISVELEGEAHEIVEAYKELQGAWEGGIGLPAKEFNALFDKLYTKKVLDGDPGELEKLNICQKFAIDSLKRAIRR